ncbi:hypothetical protein pb186bvf_004972 [Paramecium bursaria]
MILDKLQQKQRKKEQKILILQNRSRSRDYHLNQLLDYYQFINSSIHQIIYKIINQSQTLCFVTKSWAAISLIRFTTYIIELYEPKNNQTLRDTFFYAIDFISYQDLLFQQYQVKAKKCNSFQLKPRKYMRFIFSQIQNLYYMEQYRKMTATQVYIPSDGLQAIYLLLDDIKSVQKQGITRLSDECDQVNIFDIKKKHSDALIGELCSPCKQMVYKKTNLDPFFDKIRKSANMMEQKIRDLETIICDTRPFSEKILWLNNQNQMLQGYDDSRDSKIYKQKILKYVDSSFEANQLYEKNEQINELVENLNNLRIQNEKQLRLNIEFKNEVYVYTEQFQSYELKQTPKNIQILNII